MAGTAAGNHVRPPEAPDLSTGAVERVFEQAAAGRSTVDDRFFRQLVASMRNGVLAITRAGIVAALNPEACRILDLPNGQHGVGQSFRDVFEGHPDVIRALGSAFELSALPNRAEMRLKRSGRVIGYTLSHVLDADGRAAGVAMFFKDLTRIEQLEERERLRDRLAALGEMAAALAHELKNPLAGIGVMAGLLRRHLPDSADSQAILKDIISEAKMANAIVAEMLEFVRPIRLQVERVALAEIIHDAINTAEHKVPRGEVTVTMRGVEALPPIEADGHQLRLLFANLLINAFEALEQKGEVRIAAGESPHDGAGLLTTERHEPIPSIFVEVADNGPGVPPELVDRIFNAFFTTKPQGSGLGLATVRKIVDAHEGRIDFVTVAGEGARFRVTLPMASGREWYQ